MVWNIYRHDERPLGHSWEEWTVLWSKWMLSIPKKFNPSLDETGKYCSVNQNSEEVWYLTGTFGNTTPVIRRCNIQECRSILLPIIMKEDSFLEDVDISTDLELTNRCRDAINKVIRIEATIDGVAVEQLKRYRFRSPIFDLSFPIDNIYDVKAESTRSVCDGYWLFIKPLSRGEHKIHFKGECKIDDPNIIARLESTDAYYGIRNRIVNQRIFSLEVQYNLVIVGT